MSLFRRIFSENLTSSKSFFLMKQTWPEVALTAAVCLLYQVFEKYFQKFFWNFFVPFFNTFLSLTHRGENFDTWCLIRGGSLNEFLTSRQKFLTQKFSPHVFTYFCSWVEKRNRSSYSMSKLLNLSL